MHARDLLKFAIRALTERKLRATLTILGIVIGPATIVSLVGATQGYTNAASQRFSSLGATTIFVNPIGRGTTLTSANLPEIQALQGVTYVLPYQDLSGQISQGGQNIGVQVVAVDLTQIGHVLPSLSLVSGSTPSSSDLVGAVIGSSIANPGIQYANNVTVDEVVTVSNVGRSFGFGGIASSGSVATQRSFVVRGTLGKFGQGFVINPDNAIFIPLESGRTILRSQDYTGVMVVASDPSTVSQVIAELTALFGQTVRVISISSLLSTIQSVTQGTATLLEAVGGTSVLVAFIGIMTTMLTSVIERTEEIGVLKALGTNSRGIISIFLAEALVTGILGGAVGVVAGSALSFVVISYLGGSSLAIGSAGGGGGGFGGGRGGFGPPSAASSSSTLSITPVITPEVVVLAILIAVGVATLGGLLPAWRASRLNPVEALKRS